MGKFINKSNLTPVKYGILLTLIEEIGTRYLTQGYQRLRAQDIKRNMSCRSKLSELTGNKMWINDESYAQHHGQAIVADCLKTLTDHGVFEKRNNSKPMKSGRKNQLHTFYVLSNKKRRIIIKRARIA